jgi:CheY-like chemotaxis protein
MSHIVLVVDDSMLIRHAICRFLEERGFIVETATNGHEALAALKQISPALIVTDMLMPGMSGGELITALKSQLSTASIPVVVVAGRQSDPAGCEKRADFVIYKDIDIQEQLGEAVDQLFGSSSAKGLALGK